MIQDPPELAAMKLALGQQLAALRQAAEFGQQQVGRKTGYSRSSIAKAEAGRQLLTRDFWTTADKLLNADGALLDSYEQVRAAKEEHEAMSREAALAMAYAEAKAQELRATALPEAQNGHGLVVPTGQEVLACLVSAVGAELAGGLAGPLLYVAFLSNSSQAVPGSGFRQVGPYPRSRRDPVLRPISRGQAGYRRPGRGAPPGLAIGPEVA